MILNTLEDYQKLKTAHLSHPLPLFDSVLMAAPDFFEVVYAINPFMKDKEGRLNQVDKAKAHREWNELVSVFSKINLKTKTVNGVSGLPDMVFSANQSFPFWNPQTQRYEIVLSKMRSPQRAQEVPYFKQFWTEQGFVVHELSYKGAFEGNGDAIFSPEHGIVFGGFGSRTDKEVYEELSSRFNLTIARLELCSSDFYHLDTCFSILSKDTVAIQPDAFSGEGLSLIRAFFDRVVEIPYEENKNYFCGNCFSPDGKNVVTQKGSPTFKNQLEQLGFTVWEVDTGEFMKSGGSVFCLKLFYPG